MGPEENQLVAALRSVGLQIDSVWDLLQWRQPYAIGIPILTNMLPVVTDLTLQEGIVRALTVKEAHTAVEALLRQYDALIKRGDEASAARWAISNALRLLARNEHAPEVLRLLENPAVTDLERQQLVRTLARLKYRAAIPTLVALLDNATVQGQAAAALGKLKATEAREFLRPLLVHPVTWVRREAEKAIECIDGVRKVTRRRATRERS